MENSTIKTYRDLIVWQKSMTLVTLIYELTGQYPKSENFGITSQTRRSAVSIPSNIAEGYGRDSIKDYTRFLKIAKGSLYELQTQIEIGSNLNYLKNEDFKNIYENTREIERMLKARI